MTLSSKQREFARLVGRLLRAIDSLGYEVTLGEAYRPPETAALYAKEGRGIARSLHTARLAIDLNLWRNNQYLTDPKEYLPAGELWESYSTPDIHCCWGGRFQIADAVHFSIAHGDLK